MPLDKEGKNYDVKIVKNVLTGIPVGGPYSLFINSEIYNNIYVGDVWILAGQSNMEGHGRLSQEDKFYKKNPNIRIEKKHTPKIIVIDSLNTLPVNSYKYVKELTDLLPNKLFILIGWGKMDRGQVKPDGAIVKKAIFYADVKIKVEAFRAYANARGNSKTTVYTISEEMAKIYEAQL